MNVAKLVKEAHDQYVMAHILEGVETACFPWRIKGVDMFVDYDICEGPINLVINVFFPKSDDQWWYSDTQPIPLLAEEDEIVAMVIDRFTSNFRSWRKRPENNIELGEN